MNIVVLSGAIKWFRPKPTRDWPHAGFDLLIEGDSPGDFDPYRAVLCCMSNMPEALIDKLAQAPNGLRVKFWGTLCGIHGSDHWVEIATETFQILPGIVSLPIEK